MRAYEFILVEESNTQATPLLKHIVSIFDSALKKYTDKYEATGWYIPNGVTIQFIDLDRSYVEQTATLTLELVDNKYDLHLEDVYIPDEVKGRGYLTEVLSEIRKLPELSGKCRVHVAINPAWQKIIDRSGFKRILPPSNLR